MSDDNKTQGARATGVWFDECAVIEADQLASPVLQRLIDEVRNEKTSGSTQVYNRIHNRHNRGGG